MPRNYQEPAHTWDDAERARLEPLVREDYDRCHPDDSFDDMKRRVPWPFGYRLPAVPAESSVERAAATSPVPVETFVFLREGSH